MRRALILFVLLLLGPWPAPARAESALLAVATNFASAMDVLVPAFEAESGHDLNVSFGATGKLYAQIIGGAPYDAFLAADQARPARLFAEGQGDAPFTYAEGVLVWWPKPPDPEDPRKIAIANPDLAPYGRAASEVLAQDEHAPLRTRVVMGENVGQAFAIAATGNAQTALVALSSVLSHNDSAEWSPAPGHGPILQDAILLERGRGNAAATAFLDYLQSAAARDIIRKLGYR